jgi:UDP-glucose 4-epimerase
MVPESTTIGTWAGVAAQSGSRRHACRVPAPGELRYSRIAAAGDLEARLPRAQLYIGSPRVRHSIMRLANVYGPRQDPSGEAVVIPIFCQAALANRDLTVYGNGTQTRDYAYVGDVVAAFLAAAEVDRPGIWNIGTGLEISVLDLVQIVARVAGRPLRPKFSPARRGELQCSVLSVSKAFRDLGWRAPTCLAEGIGSVCRWIEAGLPDRGAC